jgi:hypothetical protein
MRAVEAAALKRDRSTSAGGRYIDAEIGCFVTPAGRAQALSARVAGDILQPTAKPWDEGHATDSAAPEGRYPGCGG